MAAGAGRWELHPVHIQNSQLVDVKSKSKHAARPIDGRPNDGDAFGSSSSCGSAEAQQVRTEQLSLQDGKATHAVTAFYPSATTPSLQRTGEAVLAASEVASKLLRVAKQSNNTMNYSAECTCEAPGAERVS